MATFLITGGAGFFGSHLVDALLGQGHHIRVLDDFSSGALTSLASVRNDIELLLGNLNDQALVHQAVKDVEVVFHLAATPPAICELGDPLAQQLVYAPETLNVLTASRQAEVRRVVFASSVKIYGKGGGDRVREADQIIPNSLYGFAKLAAEMHCLRFTYLHGLETVRLRFADTFGPRQSPSSGYAQRLSAIVKAMLSGQQPILESLVAWQDYLYIDDAIHALLLAAAAPRVSGQVYNIGRGRYVNEVQLVAMINQLLETHIQPLISTETKEESWNRPMDISRAELDLGFCPGIDLQQGLVILMDYYAEHGGFSIPKKLLSIPGKKRTTMVHAQPSQSPTERRPL